MSVICKYAVTRIGTQQLSPDGAKTVEIDLRAVGDGSPENKEFFAWTPWGELKLTTKDQNIIERFAGWGQFYLTIERKGDHMGGDADPKDALAFRVAKIGNRSDASKKIYDVEMTCIDTRASGMWNMGTVNEAAARAFLGFGDFDVWVKPAAK